MDFSRTRKFPNESITFRVARDALNRLRYEAERRQVSLNTLVNQIFRQQADFQLCAPEAGMMYAPRVLLAKLISRLNDEDIRDVAQYLAKNEFKQNVLLLRKNYDIASILELTVCLLRASGLAHRYEVSDDKHLFVIQHGMGRKWSLYWAEFYRTVFGELGTRKIECDILENVFTLKVDVDKK